MRLLLWFHKVGNCCSSRCYEVIGVVQKTSSMQKHQTIPAPRADFSSALATRGGGNGLRPPPVREAGVAASGRPQWKRPGLACSWLHSQTVRGVGVGFEEPHLRLMV